MNAVFAVGAALAGAAAGAWLGRAIARREVEYIFEREEQLVAALRFARGVAVERGLRPLARYIERVLDEATGT